MLSFACARAALALTIVTQQAPPDTATITPIPPSAAEPAPEVSPPPRFEPKLAHGVRLGPLISGAVIFGVSYAVAVFFGWVGLVSCIESENPDCGSQAKFLFVPLAGPAVAAANPGSQDLFADISWATYLTWSFVQVAGAALLIYGAVGHDVPRKRPRPRATLGFAPVASPAALGLGLNGTW